MIERRSLERMKGEELVRMARVLKMPLPQRKVKRVWLIDEIMETLESRANEKGPEPEKKLKNPAIELTRISKKFGRTVAVANLDLTVNPGEIVGLVGPNGAGKTTTLRVLTGIIRPTSGKVVVNGHNMANEPILAKQVIGYIPEQPTCYPSLTVREYITFMARTYNTPPERTIVRMREYVDMFQMEEYLNNFVGTLSKGNLQRTLLAGIFVRDPPFVLAFDEPIYGLDPRGAWSLKAHLKTLKDAGSAILVSTHILEVAEGLCDRFVIMHEGQVVGKGTLPELLTKFPRGKTLEDAFLGLTGGLPYE